MSRKDDLESKKLLKAFANGDKEAFNELYRLHIGGLWVFVGRLLGTKDVKPIGSVCQEVWLTVMRKASVYDPDGGAMFSTWLLEIGKYCCKAHKSAADRQKAADERVAAKRGRRPEGVRAPDLLERRELVVGIKAMLRELPVEPPANAHIIAARARRGKLRMPE